MRLNGLQLLARITNSLNIAGIKLRLEIVCGTQDQK